MEKQLEKLEKLVKENYYEQSAARVGIATGLLNCSKLDEIAKNELEKIGITPEIYYKTRENVTNRGDRMAAARYYSQFLDIQEYEMHHTADGNYIIPVEEDLHKNTKHIGGSFILNRRKIEKLTKEINQKQQEINEKLNEIIEKMI